MFLTYYDIALLSAILYKNGAQEVKELAAYGVERKDMYS